MLKDLSAYFSAGKWYLMPLVAGLALVGVILRRQPVENTQSPFIYTIF